MYFQHGTFSIDDHSNVKFIMNSAQYGGGIFIYWSADPHSIIADNNAQLTLYINSAYKGGALYASESKFIIKVGNYSSVHFLNNTATTAGGAVYADSETRPTSYSVCMFMVTGYYPGFHTEGGVPWDFPPLAQFPPSSFADSTLYFVLFSHPKWDQVLHLLVVKVMILYETLYTYSSTDVSFR